MSIAVDDSVELDLLAPEAELHFSVREESTQVQFHPAMQSAVAQDIQETVGFMPSMRPEIRQRSCEFRGGRMRAHHGLQRRHVRHLPLRYYPQSCLTTTVNGEISTDSAMDWVSCLRPSSPLR